MRFVNPSKRLGSQFHRDLGLFCLASKGSPKSLSGPLSKCQRMMITSEEKRDSIWVEQNYIFAVSVQVSAGRWVTLLMGP